MQRLCTLVGELADADYAAAASLAEDLAASAPNLRYPLKQSPRLAFDEP